MHYQTKKIVRFIPELLLLAGLMHFSCFDFPNPYDVPPTLIAEKTEFSWHAGEPVKEIAEFSIRADIDVDTFYISPSLPAGLSAARENAISIQGTPQSALDSTEFRLIAVNSWGNDTAYFTISISPPTPQTVTTVGFSTDSVQIKWNASEKAAIYNVYKKNSATDAELFIGSTIDTIFTDTSNLVHGSVLYYRVSARGEHTGESLLSPAVSLQIDEAFAPTFHTVLFTSDATEYHRVDVAYGDKVHAPESPDAGEGRIFSHWASAEQPYDFSLPVTGDLEIIAVWEELAVFTLTYDGNGNTGGNIPAYQEAYAGQSITLRANENNLTKTDFAFAGWNTAPDGSGAHFAVNATFPMTENVTLFAEWTNLPLFTVSYDKNSASSGSVPAPQQKIENKDLVIAANSGTLSKDHFLFDGWNTKKDGSGTSYLPDEKYIDNADMVLYAQWTEEPRYRVSYKSNGSNSGTVPEDSKEYYAGDEVTVMGNVGLLERTGYAALSMWSTEQGGGQNMPFGSTFIMPDSSVNLWALWEKATYTVTFNSHGGPDIQAVTAVPHGTVISEPPSAVQRDGYEFAGWYTSENYSEEFIFQVSPVTSDITLHAKWNARSYAITYVLNGGSNNPNATDFSADKPVTLQDAQREFFVQMGWYSDPDFTTPVEEVSGSTTGWNDVTLYARWGVEDIDENVYPTVKIGDQIWTSVNLRCTQLNDGTPIPHVTDRTAWSNLSTKGYCFYDNSTDADQQEKWGALYNWYAVNTGKLAPEGWRVPTDKDWTELSDYLGGRHVAGGKLKEAGTANWASPNTGATNSSGFLALPGGYRLDFGGFNSQSSIGSWWSATEGTEGDAAKAYYSVLYYDTEVLRKDPCPKKYGYSVRLVRDN